MLRRVLDKHIETEQKEKKKMKIIIPATIHRGNTDALKQLMRDWSSCVRYAYGPFGYHGI